MRRPRHRRLTTWRGLLPTLALALLLGAGLPHTGAPLPGSDAPSRTRQRLPGLSDGATLLAVSEAGATLHALPLTPAAEGDALLRLAELGRKEGTGEGSDPHGDGAPRLHRLHAAPGGARVAIQGSTSKPLLWLLDLEAEGGPLLSSLLAAGFGEFLGWHPDGRHALVKVLDEGVDEPGLWLVDTVDGSHRVIELPELAAPEGLLAAAIAPDGERLLYAISRGMGFGSTLWLTDLAGTHHERLIEEPYALVGGLRWSPDGERAAYVAGLDAPVPFAPAVLRLLTPGEREPRRLAIMDGGHGQAPLWSPDGRTLYFVTRENPDSREADRDPTALVSSIRAVDVRGGETRVIVPADGARQIDLALAPNGDLLFASTRGGGLDIWRATPDGRLSRLTHGGTGQRSPLLIEITE